MQWSNVKNKNNIVYRECSQQWNEIILGIGCVEQLIKGLKPSPVQVWRAEPNISDKADGKY